MVLGGCDRPAARADRARGARSEVLAARPYRLRAADEHRPAPLLVALHGYGSSGEALARYFRLDELDGFIVVAPDGTRDVHGNRFWNATEACCNLFGATVDDVAYLTAVLDDVQATHNVDSRRIYVAGHSNGGFMANRLACELAPRIAAIVDVAGAGWYDPARCRPDGAVAVLHVHGDGDAIIRPAGGRVFDIAHMPPYPSVEATVGAWTAKNRCPAPPRTAAARFDFDADVPGEETRVDRWERCARGDVERWTVEGGSHTPAFTPSFARELGRFLRAHPKR